MKLESKFYNELKRNSSQITWTRLENSSVFGTPDLLGYNSFRHFFTVEQKIIRTGKIDDMSPEDLKKRMAEILEDFSGVIEGESTEEIEKKVKAKQAKIRTDVNEREKSKHTKALRPLRKLQTSDKEVTSNLASSSSSHTTKE